MRFIPTRVHGLFDYLVAIVLITAPWVLGFDLSAAETWVPVLVGVGIALYSLFTDYEWFVSRHLPMSTHLALDFAGGLLLALSPWLFGFADRVRWPHVVLGLIAIVASVTTEAVPGRLRGPSGSPTLGAGRG
jgi:threonine/homoserine efflux transporter RhtA